MTEIDRPGSAPRKLTRRRVLAGGGVGGVLALSGGAASAADRFLLEHVGVAGASTLYEDAPATSTASSTASTVTVSTDTSWSGATGSVNLKTVATGSGSTAVTYFAADITLSSPTGLRSGFAKDTFGENVIEGLDGRTRRRGGRDQRRLLRLQIDRDRDPQRRHVP